MSETFDRLHEYVSSLEIIDTHEHLPGQEDQRSRDSDVLSEYLIHYFSCDLVSAGLRPEELEVVRDPSRPLAERWKLAEPFWEAARNTGYGRSLDIAARDLYGFDRIGAETIEPLNEAFAAFRAEGNTYRKVLKERCRIRLSINDAGLNHDPRFFRPTVRLDDFIMVSNMGGLRALEKRSGVDGIHTLDDLIEACEKTLDDALGHGAVCLKSGLAYRRSLRYERVATPAAEEDFHRIFSDEDIAAGGREGVWGRTGRLQDFMMHHVCRLADRRGMPFQFHTGIQEGNGNYVYHSDPALLSNLFIAYPNVRFDCFHIGYPYQQTLSVLAKNFRNVFIDFSWAHIISPAAAVAAMAEYLDAVPANKISGFGGDYCFLDGVYGHQVLARRNVAAALAIKVDEGVFTIDRAREVAKMVLHDNPIAIFGLEKALAKKGKKARGEEGKRQEGKKAGGQEGKREEGKRQEGKRARGQEGQREEGKRQEGKKAGGQEGKREEGKRQEGKKARGQEGQREEGKRQEGKKARGQEGQREEGKRQEGKRARGQEGQTPVGGAGRKRARRRQSPGAS